MKKLMNQGLLALLTVAVALVGLSINAIASEDGPIVKAIKEKGKIVMATDADYPPFVWVAMEDGDSKVVGFDADLSQLIADELGVELEVKDMNFDGLTEIVKSDKVDFIVGALTATEERQKQLDFSDPYYENTVEFAVPVDKLADYKELADFEDKKIGTQLGTVHEQLLKEAFPDANVQAMQKNSMAVDGLLAGRTDAVVMDDIVLKEYVEQHSDKIAIVPGVVLEQEDNGAAIGVAKDQEDLLKVINKVIKDNKENGKLDELMKENVKKADRN